ncbi:30S ribosomal protein S17 [Patescibacteria group bacterium]|nr:MAG: 30S ribosomal protein S17 [Patescibacteria group bacterium]
MAETKTKGKKFSGVVISDKMKDTVVVLVRRYVRHPRYGKYIEYRKKYKAHDPGNVRKVGEKVVIQETKPISKHKHFVVIQETQ